MLQKANLKHIAPFLDSSSQVLMRTDFNVPIKENKIVDPTRIQGISINDLSHYSYHQQSPLAQSQVSCHSLSSWKAWWQKRP